MGRRGAYLGHHVSDLNLGFLLGALEALPEVIADAAALLERGESLLGVADLEDAVDVFDCASEEGGF